MPDSTRAKRSIKVAPERVFKVFIKASAREVWKEITRTDAPIACFFNSRMELGPGGLTPGTRLAMRTPNGKNTGVVGAILEIVPLKRFAHTFQFTSEHEPPCVVTYTLAEVSGGTEFTLTITDCADGSKTQKQMVQGSSIIVNTLKAVLETGRPSFGIRMLFLLIKLMPAPNRCRSEHWPVG